MLRLSSRLLYLTLAVAGIAVTSAQESINYASISGRVIDPSGGVVQGAQVTARQTVTNLSSTVETDREGRFRFPYLKLGAYEITVHTSGFADAVRPITLSVGSAFELPFSLAVKGGETTLTVDGDAGVIEAARSQIAGTVSQSELSNLPLNGRSFLDLALLIPGVSPTNTGSTQLFAETTAVPGQGISIGSQRNFSNSLIVDGLSANDDASGLAGTFAGLETVQEFQVVTSGGQAEFGRALGGYISMVTKSGTNSMHGDLYAYLRNQRLNAANALSNTRLPLTQTQFGATLGGPAVRDRTFYFANFEQRQLNQNGIITISPASATSINARLGALGYQGPSVTTGQYPNPVDTTNFMAKLDHQFNQHNQFTSRYNLYRVNSENSRGVGGLSSASAAAGLSNVDQTVAASNIATLSSRTVNETRGQFTSSNLDAPPNDPFGPAVSISGIAIFGRLSSSPTARSNKLYEVADNLSHQAGAHALRAGMDFLFNDLGITYPQSSRGSYTFSSIANFLTGTYNNAGFAQSFGSPIVAQTNPNFGFYAQDEWKVTPRLTLNAGIRYDLQFLKTIATDTNNISPRAGLAWSPFASRRTVVRASFGLFYDRVPLRALANALLSSGNTTNFTSDTFVTVSLSPTQTGAPTFPNILPALPQGVLPNFTTMDRHMQNAYSAQTSVEVETQLGEHTTFSAGYQHLRGLHLIASVNRNTPLCIAAGNNNGCRPNAGYANNRQYSAAADSNYNGLHLSLIARPVRWGNYRISYSYSKAMDDVGEFFFSAPIDNFNIWQDYGRSDDDLRHRFVFDAIVPPRLTRGFQLSTTLQYYSALPFNIVTGASTTQGTNARPVLPSGAFITRNAGTGFDSVTMNTRLTRNFALGSRLKLQAIAEAFNTLNHRNNLIPNGTFGAGVYPLSPSSSFRQPAAVGDPRTMQLALRLTF